MSNAYHAASSYVAKKVDQGRSYVAQKVNQVKQAAKKVASVRSNRPARWW
ncbi:hypothetical protein ACNTMW_13350 [Planosporangium sp. 12N6]